METLLFIEEDAILKPASCQILSAASLRRRSAFAQAPVLEQALAAPRIARLERPARGDPVGAEMAKALPELAPGHDDARFVEIADPERPDRAFGLRPLRVMVFERQLAFGPDRGAERGRARLRPGLCRAR